MSIPRLVSYNPENDHIVLDKSGFFDSNNPGSQGGELSEDSDSHIFSDQVPSNRNYYRQPGGHKKPIEVRRGWGENKADEYFGPEEDDVRFPRGKSTFSAAAGGGERGRSNKMAMRAEKNLTRFPRDSPEPEHLEVGLESVVRDDGRVHLGARAAQLKSYIQVAVDPMLLAFQPGSSVVILHDRAMPGVTEQALLFSLVGSSKYLAFEGEVLRILLKQATSRIKSLLHPSKRGGVPQPPEELKPFHPAPPTSLRTETVNEKQLESSALEGFVRTPLIKMEKPDQLQTTKQPDELLSSAGKIATAPAQREKKSKHKKKGKVKAKKPQLQRRKLKMPWYFLEKPKE